MSVVNQPKSGGDVVQGQTQVLGQSLHPSAFAPIATGLNTGEKEDTAFANSGFNTQLGANVGIQSGEGGDVSDQQAIDSGNIGLMAG